MNSEFYNLPLLYQNQSMKEVTINEALAKIDCLINKAVKAKLKDLNLTSEEGDIVIISKSEKEDLKPYEDHLAYFFNNKWEFVRPRSGMIFYIVSEARFNIYLNGKWKALDESKVI